MEVMKKIYLSIPYTWNPERSFEIANKVAAELMLAGNVVYSPISMGHNIAQHLPGEARTSSDWWRKFEPAFIEWCDEMVVVRIIENDHPVPFIAGWDLISKSEGVQAEIKIAKELRKPVTYRYYND